MHKTIRQRLMILKRRYPFRTRYGFLHSTKRDLNRTFASILVYFLVFAPEKGYSVFTWNPNRRGNDWTSLGWNRWLRKEGIEIFKGDGIRGVIPAINAKRGDNWELHRLIGFSGDDYKPRSFPVIEKRKRKSRAIHKNQHRNKRKKRN